MNVLDDAGLSPVPAPPARECDARCTAQAFVFVDVNGTELAYCGHHGSAWLTRLQAAGTVIIDLRHAIGTAK